MCAWCTDSCLALRWRNRQPVVKAQGSSVARPDCRFAQQAEACAASLDSSLAASCRSQAAYKAQVRLHVGWIHPDGHPRRAATCTEQLRTLGIFLVLHLGTTCMLALLLGRMLHMCLIVCLARICAATYLLVALQVLQAGKDFASAPGPLKLPALLRLPAAAPHLLAAAVALARVSADTCCGNAGAPTAAAAMDASLKAQEHARALAISMLADLAQVCSAWFLCCAVG